MTQLIKLSDAVHVAAGLIAEVKVNSHAHCITVRMKDGICHRFEPEYRESLYAAQDRLIAQINEALAK